VDDELETERAELLVCEECGIESEDDARGWRGISPRRRTAR